MQLLMRRFSKRETKVLEQRNCSKRAIKAQTGAHLNNAPAHLEMFQVNNKLLRHFKC